VLADVIERIREKVMEEYAIATKLIAAFHSISSPNPPLQLVKNDDKKIYNSAFIN
jgi:hypothetical protein